MAIQVNPLDRLRELTAVLTPKNGTTVSLSLDSGVVLKGTLNTSQIANSLGALVTITDATPTTWTVSLFNVLAVGV
jgi:hypothetical protein